MNESLLQLWHLSSNVVTSKIVLRELVIRFEGHKFDVLMYLKQSDLVQKGVEIFYRILNLPSNGVFAKIARRNLYLFLKVKICKCYYPRNSESLHKYIRKFLL